MKIVYKRELGYTIILFVIWEFLVSVSLLGQYLLISWLGLISLLVWIVLLYIYYSYNKVSKYSEVILTLQLKRHWYQYIAIPVLLYISVTMFLFMVHSMVFQQFIILTNSTLFFILMVHIRGSYEKTFIVAHGTKVIFDLINIMVFFMLVTSLSLMATVSTFLIVVAVTVTTILMLTASLKIEEKLGKDGLLWSLIGALIIGIIAYLGQGFNIYVYPFILTLTFYLILAFWHIRLSGVKKVSEYITPLLFTLMALILLLS